VLDVFDRMICAQCLRGRVGNGLFIGKTLDWLSFPFASGVPSARISIRHRPRVIAIWQPPEAAIHSHEVLERWRQAVHTHRLGVDNRQEFLESCSASGPCERERRSVSQPPVPKGSTRR
jgi:hypothetical protein